jgi:hypothetical protein
MTLLDVFDGIAGAALHDSIDFHMIVRIIIKELYAAHLINPHTALPPSLKYCSSTLGSFAVQGEPYPSSHFFVRRICSRCFEDA